jgi:hypothetical protein
VIEEDQSFDFQLGEKSAGRRDQQEGNNNHQQRGSYKNK